MAKGVDLPSHAWDGTKGLLQEPALREGERVVREGHGRENGQDSWPEHSNNNSASAKPEAQSQAGWGGACARAAAVAPCACPPPPPVPPGGLVNHAHVVSGGLIVLHVAAVHKLQLQVHASRQRLVSCRGAAR